MKNRRANVVVTIALATAAFGSVAAAQTDGALTPEQRAEIQAMIDAAAAGGAAAPTAAAGALLTATDPAALLAVMQRYGSAELGVDEVGDPQVTGDVGGIKYQMSFYGCTDNVDCRDVIFIASFSGSKISDAQLNQWNRDNRFGSSYRGDDSDIYLQMPVNLYGGVSETNWDDTVDWWRLVTTDFRDYVYQ